MRLDYRNFYFKKSRNKWKWRHITLKQWDSRNKKEIYRRLCPYQKSNEFPNNFLGPHLGALEAQEQTPTEGKEKQSNGSHRTCRSSTMQICRQWRWGRGRKERWGGRGNVTQAWFLRDCVPAGSPKEGTAKWALKACSRVSITENPSLRLIFSLVR